MRRTSRGAAIDSPMPPNRLPLSPDRSRKPKCSLAWARTSPRIAPPPGVLGQEVERLALGGTCRLVHQRPQTGDLLEDPLAPQKVQPGRQDGGLDHRVLCPVEAGEVTRTPLVDHASEEAPPIFAEVLRLDGELLPGAGVFEDPGAHPVRRPGRRAPPPRPGGTTPPRAVRAPTRRRRGSRWRAAGRRSAPRPPGRRTARDRPPASGARGAPPR